MTVDRRTVLDGVALLGWLALCFTVAGLGATATFPHIPTWYAELAKPSWTPPNRLFGPVWTTLYAMMAVAAWLVGRSSAKGKVRPALALFLIQLTLNCAWSFLFFAGRNPAAGLVDIVLLWLAIVATIFLFARVSMAAAGLLFPYLCWISYAAALNAAIWRLNP
ncbi:MAG: TspO/MBR family protein [Planctomycetia bacterium]